MPRSATAAKSRSAISLPGVAVEIAGRLVGDQDGRLDGERAGDRDPLLLAAGKLRRIVRQPLAEADLAEHGARPREGVGAARRAPAARRRSPAPSSSASGGRPGRRSRSRCRGSARAGPRRGRHSPGPATTTRPAVDPLQPGDHHEERGFPRAGRPDQADAFAARAPQRSTPRSTCTRAGPLPSVRSTLSRRMTGSSHRRAAYIDAANSGIWVEDEQVQNATPRRMPRSLRRACRGRAPRRARSRSRSSRSATASPPDTASARANRFPSSSKRRCRARGHDVTVANAGVSGDTASDGLARLEWSVPAEADIVIVELGANDALRGIDPGRHARRRCRRSSRSSQGAVRRCCSPACSRRRNLGHAYAEAFDPIYPDLAAEYGVPLYPFFLEGVATRRRRSTRPDGMHPTAAGVAKIVESDPAAMWRRWSRQPPPATELTSCRATRRR